MVAVSLWANDSDQLRGCDHASGVRVMYGVCSGLRYKVMGPTVRREDLKDKANQVVWIAQRIRNWYLVTMAYHPAGSIGLALNLNPWPKGSKAVHHKCRPGSVNPGTMPAHTHRQAAVPHAPTMQSILQPISHKDLSLPTLSPSK